jgi:hypothetical protein
MESLTAAIDWAGLFADKGVGHYPIGDLGREGIRKLFLQDVGKGNLGLGEGVFYPHIMRLATCPSRNTPTDIVEEAHFPCSIGWKCL